MVHVGDAAGELSRMMIWQQMRSGRQLYLARLHQRLRDQQVRRRIGLPSRGEMLPNPGLAVAKAIGLADDREIPLLAGQQATLRRMRRHQKQSQFHSASSVNISVRPAQLYFSCENSAGVMILLLWLITSARSFGTIAARRGSRPHADHF